MSHIFLVNFRSSRPNATTAKRLHYSLSFAVFYTFYTSKNLKGFLSTSCASVRPSLFRSSSGSYNAWFPFYYLFISSFWPPHVLCSTYYPYFLRFQLRWLHRKCFNFSLCSISFVIFLHIKNIPRYLSP